MPAFAVNGQMDEDCATCRMNPELRKELMGKYLYCKQYCDLYKWEKQFNYGVKVKTGEEK